MDNSQGQTLTQYSLGICELFHPLIHGFSENSDRNIVGKFLLYEIFEPEEFYEGEYLTMLELHYNAYNTFYVRRIEAHPTIRNYHNIIENNNYYKIDIVESEVLPTLETVCVIKTFWIKLIQRKWKKIYKQRMEILAKIKNPKILMKREYYGKFPIGLNRYPGLR